MDNFFHLPFIYQWNRLRNCRGAALLRLITSFRNKMGINKITNEFIMLFVVLSCRVTRRRSTLRLYNHVQFSILNCQLSIDEVCAKLIFNSPFSIFNCFAPLLASLIVNCPLSILNCFTVLLNNEKLTLPGVA